MAVLEKILSSLSWLHQLVFDGVKLRSYEKVCLDAWRNSLSKKERVILDSQLLILNFIQRQAGGAKICFFSLGTKQNTRNSIPLFGNQKLRQNVAEIVLVSNDGKPGVSIKVKIFITRGQFFSIEFPKRPARYMKIHGMNEASLSVLKINKLRKLSAGD